MISWVPTVGFIVTYLFPSAVSEDQVTARAELRIRVMDEAGRPLPAIRVLVSTSAAWVPDTRMIVRDEAESVAGRTDTNGMVVLRLESRDGRVSCLAMPEPGFQWPRAVEYRFTNMVEGRWEPWSPEISIVLKRATDSPWGRPPTNTFSPRVSSFSLESDANRKEEKQIFSEGR